MEPRDLPSVDALAGELASRHGLALPLATVIARDAVDEARRILLEGGMPDPIEDAAERAVSLASARPHRVINATGVLLHTNLGRAPALATAA